MGVVVAALAFAGVVVGSVTSYAKPTSSAESDMMAQESCKKTPTTEEGYYTCPPGNYLGGCAICVALREVGSTKTKP